MCPVTQVWKILIYRMVIEISKESGKWFKTIKKEYIGFADRKKSRMNFHSIMGNRCKVIYFTKMETTALRARSLSFQSTLFSLFLCVFPAVFYFPSFLASTHKKNLNSSDLFFSPLSLSFVSAFPICVSPVMI